MRNLLSVAALALLAQAGSAAGAAENRIEILAMREGTRVEGSEVCFFAADRDDGFFAKFLSTNDVRCMSAAAVLNLPPGLFNIFVRNGSALVSSHPTFVDNANPGPPSYRALAVSLLPAATLNVEAARKGLGEHEWLAVYLSNEGRLQSPASVRPVSDDDSTVTLPAGMPVVPLVVRDGAIVRVGRPLRLRAEETAVLEPVERWGSGRDVVALVRAEPPTSPELPRNAPSVQLDGGTGDPLIPVVELRAAGRFDRSLAIFKDVTAGTYRLRLAGEGWQPDEVPVVRANTGGVVTAERSITAKIAAAVEIRTSIGELAGLVDDVRCPSLQSKEPAAASAPLLRLFRCDDDSRSREEDCALVRSVSLSADRAEAVVTWPDLAPGRYAVELTHLGVKERTAEWNAHTGVNKPVAVALQPETVTGRVTHGKSAVQAVVSFDHSVVPAVSDQSGSYTALVAGGPRRSVVTVRLCESDRIYRYLPNEPVGPVLDITVPKNELVIRVVDEQHRPIPGALVRGGPLFPEGDAEYADLLFPPTAKSGETRLANLPTGAALRLCAFHAPDYDQACATDFRMHDQEARRVEIMLRSRVTMSGRLRSAAPFVGAMIWLVSQDGVILDAARVSPTGEFALKRIAAPGAYVVSASRSHPLVSFEMPDAPGREIELDVPSGGRAFDVVLPRDSRKRRLSLEAGGRIIPTAALRMHQALRGLTDIAGPGETVQMRDVALQGTLTVYSVPYITDYPPAWAGIDPIERPELRIALPRAAVTGAVVRLE
ncbi:MAG TPA: hypothetical protein VE974_01465 [Thermoanaerobaculia bacterium]|nr:hypothetical protein [Thermoanaerobaculia bacterium]